MKKSEKKKKEWVIKKETFLNQFTLKDYFMKEAEIIVSKYK